MNIIVDSRKSNSLTKVKLLFLLIASTIIYVHYRVRKSYILLFGFTNYIAKFLISTKKSKSLIRLNLIIYKSHTYNTNTQ